MHSFESTTANDISGVGNDKSVCKLGEGTVVSFMDSGTMYDRHLYDIAMSSGIKCQPKSAVAGGNNSGSIHLTRSGVRTLALSVPCRYIHTPACVADLRDIVSVRNMAKYMLCEMGNAMIRLTKQLPDGRILRYCRRKNILQFCGICKLRKYCAVLGATARYKTYCRYVPY